MTDASPDTDQADRQPVSVRFDPGEPGLRQLEMGIYQVALAMPYHEDNQRYPVSVEVATQFAGLLRDHLPDTDKREWTTLSNRIAKVDDRRRRVKKLIADGINGLPGGSGSLLEAALRRVYGVPITTPINIHATTDVIDAIYDSTVGWGPLEKLMADPQVTEISVNAHDNVWIERTVPGRGANLERQLVGFGSETELRNYVERILQDTGKAATADQPTVDLSLPDGSRVNITIPPITPSTTISLRRPPAALWTLDSFVKVGALNDEMAEFLHDLTVAEANMIVFGGTGSGKTSVLNAVINLKDGARKRLGSIEDTHELNPLPDKIPNYVALITNEARTAQQLVKNSLRQRFDYIVVGETRDATALDLLMAFSSGTLGSASTVHAPDPIGALRRLVILARFSKDAPPDDVVRTITADAVHVLIWARRYPDGSRHIASIDEVFPELDAEGEFQVHNIFRCVQRHDTAGKTGYEFVRNPDYVMSERMVELFQAHKLSVDRWQGADAPRRDQEYN